MKVSMLLLAASAIVSSASDVGLVRPWEDLDAMEYASGSPKWHTYSIEEIMKKVVDEGFGHLPLVVTCTSYFYWVSGRAPRITTALVYKFPFTIKHCRLFWCHPEGQCVFRLDGDGGTQNWMQRNWRRAGRSKEICNAPEGQEWNIEMPDGYVPCVTPWNEA
ncbi:hypothetical protein AOL_s00176g34 [Orbilia oligospora ATCC 24927]|uniref:Uncharacterized protein n=1 Tax=Arthrobotrys oligospora (strain ATCC 24927 / CBS 115.81 / DSM 1491) TaxID=756982 RepID=G1XPR0_ARTOA|nr:hypothetical protein AOL_s00176g34 [Orbilia oligospora ATCC 24927]EGX44863.1 hypothetical protein AOL_s00176g34 [Orbilia oligospora ATCC 24927]